MSDYARYDILFHEGGIYSDTDVEVIKSFDDILTQGAFMGYEIDGVCKSHSNESQNGIISIQVNPVIGLVFPNNLQICREILDYYSTQRFILKDGSYNLETVVIKTTRILRNHGLKDICGIHQVEDIAI